MKKVILIASVSFSGSTTLDNILGNSKDSLSLGECYAYFRPHKPHHHKIKCRCAEGENCSFWKEFWKVKEEDLYSKIFEKYKYTTLIDSSKNLDWIAKQLEVAKDKDYKVKVVFIYKNPIEAEVSYRKRGLEGIYRWFLYSKKLFNMNIPMTVVSFYGLSHYPKQVTKMLCEKLDIPYTEDQEKFWLQNGERHISFGSKYVKGDSFEYDDSWKHLVDAMVTEIKGVNYDSSIH